MGLHAVHSIYLWSCSPFQMRVLPGVDVSKVKVTGPGVQGTTPASMPAQFRVDTRDAGVADLECVVQVGD